MDFGYELVAAVEEEVGADEAEAPGNKQEGFERWQKGTEERLLGGGDGELNCETVDGAEEYEIGGLKIEKKRT